MAGGEIEVEGLDEVLQALRRLGGRGLVRAMKAAAFAIGEQVRGVISPYPTQRASANPDRWYQRGYGSRWRRSDGSIGGRKTSEQLGQKWTTRPKGRSGAVVGNPASYARVVHKAGEQAAVHAATGWVTDEEAVAQVNSSGVAVDIVTDAVMGQVRAAGL